MLNIVATYGRSLAVCAGDRLVLRAGDADGAGRGGLRAVGMMAVKW